MTLGRRTVRAKANSNSIPRGCDWSFALGQSAEQEGSIDVLPELVIVRHAPRVLSQVQTVLSDMRMLNLKQYDSGRRPECDYAGRLGGKAASSDLAEEPTADDDGI